MDEVNLNDFIMDIVQDFIEIESITKVLKDSACNENSDVEIKDIVNVLEILLTKISNTKYSLNKYIECAF